MPARAVPVRVEAESPEVQAALATRNTDLARFWLDSREPGALEVPALAGRSVAIVDGEERHADILEPLGGAADVEAFRGHVQKLEFAFLNPGEPIRHLTASEGAVHECGW